MQKEGTPKTRNSKILYFIIPLTRWFTDNDIFRYFMFIKKDLVVQIGSGLRLLDPTIHLVQIVNCFVYLYQ